MFQRKVQRRSAAVMGVVLASMLFASPSAVRAVSPPVQAGQFAHTSWTSRDGYSLGGVFAMAQTPDGYLWLASENGLVRFDGDKFTPWLRRQALGGVERTGYRCDVQLHATGGRQMTR